MPDQISIGFDARYIRTDYHDGISRFSARLGTSLHELTSQHRNVNVTFIVCDEKQLEHLPRGADHVFANSPTSLNEGSISRRLNAFNFDVVYSPMQTIGARGRKFPLVVTVHDLIYYIHRRPPRQFNLFIRALWRLYHLSWWPQRTLLNRADRVVAVSEVTKQLILDNHLTHHEVSVVHNASDLTNYSSNPPAMHAARRSGYVLYMGSFMPYKNVETLVHAMNLTPQTKLKLVSRISYKDEARFRELNTSSNIEFLNGISDQEYVSELQNASALVTASLAEGFGIPVVEAMSLGTPVICSDIPIFREIGGDAPIFVSPNDAAGFSRAIVSLNDDALASRMSRLGLVQSQKFTWNKSAQDLLDVLKNVAHS